MNIDRITNLLMDIPTVLCRNMNKKFVNTTLINFEKNLSQHHFMILRLLKNREQVYITEIVDELSITKSQMTATIDKLIILGYVKRENDKNDRRKILIHLTKQGELITDKIIVSLNEKILKNLNKLTDNESETLRKGIEILFKYCNLYK